MIINEQIAWRRGHVDLSREPQAEDVAKGLAGILFSGELLMNEGSKVEVVDGKLLFTSGRSSFGQKIAAAVEEGYRALEPLKERDTIRSANFVEGVSGWELSMDGSLRFYGNASST